MSKVSRRDFTRTAALTGAGFVIVPRSVLGRGQQAPSDRVNIAVVGIGGMGGNNAQAVMSQNIVALCDVDDVLMERRLSQWRDRAFPLPPSCPLRRAPRRQAPVSPGRVRLRPAVGDAAGAPKRFTNKKTTARLRGTSLPSVILCWLP